MQIGCNWGIWTGDLSVICVLIGVGHIHEPRCIIMKRNELGLGFNEESESCAEASSELAGVALIA